MATKTDFTPEEWTLLRAAPVLAGLRVAVADHGGNFDEVAAIAQAFVEAHERLWSTPPRGGVVEEIIADGPFYDRAHFGDSPDKLDAERITEASTTSLRDAVALLERKASAAEVQAYREFVLDLARRVAEAHQEAGMFDHRASPVSERERAALAELASVFPAAPAAGTVNAVTKTDFTPEEWTLLRAAPVLAGLRVAVADHGGNFDEVAAIAEAYGAAHERWWSNPGEGGLVNEIIADGPFYDRAHFGDSPDKLDAERITEASTTSLRDAVALLERKASAAEVQAYREFVLDLARRVAEAHQEAGVFDHRAGPVSERERAALAELASVFPAGVRSPALQP